MKLIKQLGEEMRKRGEGKQKHKKKLASKEREKRSVHGLVAGERKLDI